jgi:hypothetical protein
VNGGTGGLVPGAELWLKTVVILFAARTVRCTKPFT